MLGIFSGGSGPGAGRTRKDPQPAKPEAVLFDALPVVEAASLHTQTLMEAPASVTVITDEDIWRRGYRTLAEVLGDVRGFYVTYDRAYQFVGVRGISIPGDYNTRFLVMINGHSLSENIYSSAGYFGQDFGLDLDLIKRIEIIRGPSSALYGSNGELATINIVTKSPVELEGFRVSAETDSLGERKTEVTAFQYLGRGANLLVSASVFNNTGQSLYFPEFDTPETNNGWAVGMDGERGYHTFADLIWHDWSFLAYFNAREKEVPTAWYGATFNDRGTDVVDGRGFFETSYEHDVGVDGKLRWRIYYDRYRYTGRYESMADGVAEDQRDGAAVRLARQPAHLPVSRVSPGRFDGGRRSKLGFTRAAGLLPGVPGLRKPGGHRPFESVRGGVRTTGVGALATLEAVFGRPAGWQPHGRSIRKPASRVSLPAFSGQRAEAFIRASV